MQLREINKARYRQHLNRLLAVCIIALALGSLGIAQLLISIFPSDSGSHFHWNLLGVIITCMLIAWLLNSYKEHDYLTEVVYVWELKQTLNKINRKMPKLQAAAENGDIDALTVLQYSYAGSRQLWQLDDNTIVMDELAVKQAQLDSMAAELGVTLNANNYHETTLRRFH